MSSILLNKAFSQQNRLLRLHTPLGENVFIAEYLDGWEALDQGGYCLELSVLSSDGRLPLEQLVGAQVLLQMQCADSRSELRPFHGHVSHYTRVGSNGGLARYQLRIEPWLGLLRYRQDSYAFHDMSVVQICDQIFGFYHRGVIHPHWRWELEDRGRYRQRSLTTQYQETDFDFVQRLLAEEGIAYRFEHQGDPRSPSLGCHTLVLSDSNFRLAPQAPASVPFQRSDVTANEDGIQQWEEEHHWVVSRVTRQSWDYRSHQCLSARADSHDGIKGCEDHDSVGLYAWNTWAQGERLAHQHLDALHVTRQQVHSRGTWRRLAPGSRLCLKGNASVAADEAMLCLRVRHQARNNLDAQLQAAVLAALGPPPDAIDALYVNQFNLIPARQTYRPQTRDGHGRRLHPRPTVQGSQSALVIGDGDPLLTDRDHRIKVQFHWQRGTRGSSLEPHPRGTDNAPGDARIGTWVHVAATQAGSNWGSVWIPRVGQEVLVDFLEGDIDRPVVIGALYNGQGWDNAAHNQVGGGPSGCTGNAPAWFPGNQHAGVLSGWKTQDLSSSRTGNGGYRHLQFDDSPGQSRLELYTTDQHSGLSLGHLKQTQDNQRLADRGYGSELHTQAQGAVRAGAGLLLSTEPAVQQMQADGLLSELEKTQAQIEQLAERAHQQNAGLAADSGPQLPSSAVVQDSQESLKATQEGQAAGAGIGGGEGSAVAWSKPLLALYGKAGLLSLTPKHQIWTAGTHCLLNAGADINLTAQGHTAFLAGEGLVLFTQGDSGAERPVANTGITLHAATGAISLQAQSDKVSVAAQGDIRLISTQAGAQVEGKSHVLLSAQGAAIKLSGGNIEITAPGAVTFKAQQHVLLEPKSGISVPRILGKGQLTGCEFKEGGADLSGASVVESKGNAHG